MSDRDELLISLGQIVDKCHGALGRLAQADYQKARAITEEQAACAAQDAARSELTRWQNEAAAILDALNLGPGFSEVMFARISQAKRIGR